jgi:hypothetical protein
MLEIVGEALLEFLPAKKVSRVGGSVEYHGRSRTLRGLIQRKIFNEA